MAQRSFPITRRQALAAGVASAAALATAQLHQTAQGDKGEQRAHGRMPVVYLPHGGGPWPFVEMGLDPDEVASLSAYLRGVAAVPRSKPKALLVVSAHWEEAVPTVMTAAQPPMLYDYSGFPPESYALTWPAPGAPRLAAQVREMLQAAGLPHAEDSERGYDHGTFVPLKVAYPEAEVPVVQLSLMESLDPQAHLALGRALAPLRDEGVFIVASGMSFHNMRAFSNPRAAFQLSQEFDAWLRDAVSQDATERDRRLAQWAQAPSARVSHPREEHLLPLMVAAGSAGEDRGIVAFQGRMLGAQLSAFHFG